MSDPSIVGLTSTVPVEVVFAAGLKPLDLNNHFITSRAPDRLLSRAEQAVFSHNTCAWIKGTYSTVLNHDIHSVIGVAERVRLGLLGVPPILSGLYEFLESVGARVVFNEVQRQFSIPFEDPDLLDRYLKYTYPYGIDERKSGWRVSRKC